MRTTLTLHISRILRIRYAAAMLTLGATFSNCSRGDRSPTSPPVPKPAVASVVLVGLPQNGVLLVGTTAELRATAMDATGEVVNGTVVTWSTSNSAVAIVSPSGMVTAVAAGFSVIAASAEGRSATASLEVRAAIATPDAGATQPVTTTVLSGAVTMTVPPGATAPGTKLDVGPAASATVPAAPELVAGSAFTFGPDGTQFAKPVTLTLKYDPAGLSPSGQAGLAIYLAQNGDWVPVVGSVVNTAAGTVTAPVTHFSTYALLTPGAAASVAIADGNGQSATAGAAVAVAPSVLVRDSRSRPVPNAAVTFAIVSGGGSLAAGGASSGSVSVTTSAAGTAALTSWTLGAAAGSNTLTATVAGLPLVTFTATGTAALVPAIGLSSTNAHFTYTIGDAAPAAQSVDVTNAGTGTLTGLTLGAVTYGAGASGWLTATLSGASAPASIAFSAHPGSLAAGSYTATVPVQSAVAGATSVQVTIDVSAPAPPPVAVATQLAIIAQPGVAVESGIAFTAQPVVEIRDASSQRVSGATNSVTVALASGSGTLQGTTTVNAVDGVATFTNLKIAGSGSHTLVFSAATLSSATSSASVVTQVLRQLVVTRQPAGATNGLPLATQPIVEARDAAGLLIASGSYPVTATLASGPGSMAEASVITASGVASGWNLLVLKAGNGNFTIQFSSGGISTLSAGFPVAPGRPVSMWVITNPGASESAVPLVGPASVELRDNLDNRVTDATNAVTVSLSTDAGSTAVGTLTGPTTVNAVNGVATFPGLVVTGSGSGFRLNFSAAPVTGAPAIGNRQSNAFTVVLAHSLSLNTQPAGAVSGVPLVTQPVVQLRDALGAALNSGSNIVTASLASGTGSLSGTVSVAAVNGVATFTDLRIVGVGTFTIAFSSPGVAVGATSASINTTAAVLHLSLSHSPGPFAESGILLTSQPTVEIRDAASNVVAGATDAVTVTVLAGTASIRGTTTVNAVNGVANFTDLNIAGAGNVTLQFSAATASSVSSATIGVSSILRHLAVVQQPASAVSGQYFTTSPTVQLLDGAGLPYTITNPQVSVALGSGSGTLVLDKFYTIFSNGSGLATFPALKIVGSGTFTLQFTSLNGATTTSAPFSIVPGPASNIKITTTPAGAVNGVAFITQPVVTLIDASGIPTNSGSNVLTAFISAGSGTLSGTLAVAAVNGIASFTDLKIAGTGPHTISFSGAGGLGVVTANVTVSP